jgi:hypothetical protein
MKCIKRNSNGDQWSIAISNARGRSILFGCVTDDFIIKYTKYIQTLFIILVDSLHLVLVKLVNYQLMIPRCISILLQTTNWLF